VGGVAARLRTQVQRGMAGILLLASLQLLGLAAVLAHEALEAGPRFNPRTLGSEVLVAGPAVRTRPRIHLCEEKPCRLGRKHVLVVLGKNAVVRATLAELVVEPPEPGQIGTERFAEEPLAADTLVIFTIPWDVVDYGPVESSTGIAPEA
jgi:hypothetical protein